MSAYWQRRVLLYAHARTTSNECDLVELVDLELELGNWSLDRAVHTS